METRLADLVYPGLIGIAMTAVTAREVIQELADRLCRSGNVDPSFAEDVWNREKIHPTGLPTLPFGVAIPHADPDHVIKSGIAIGVVSQPVNFRQMGDPDSVPVSARAIFLLAIRESDKQVRVIQELVRLLQSPDLLLQLVQASSAAVVHGLLRAHSEGEHVSPPRNSGQRQG